MPKGQAKITELYPRRMKRLRFKKLLVPFVVLLVLMMTGLSLYMFREDLDLDRISTAHPARRWPVCPPRSACPPFRQGKI